MKLVQYTYDYAIFIGRFQPLHDGHVAVIEKALSLARNVIVLVGSANLGRSVRNPFTYDERRQMLDASFPEARDSDRLIIAPLNDHTYGLDGWLEDTQKIVSDIVLRREIGWRDRGHPDNLNDTKVTLIGRNKDNSSYYLKLFPNWSAEDAFDDDVAFLNATDIRQAMFECPSDAAFAGSKHVRVPTEVFNQLIAFRKTPEFDAIRAEHRWCVKYKDPWKGSPYEPTFNTVDAVVKCSGHILLVTRRAHPGKGLLALPGGFLDKGETLMQSCLRELKEETLWNSDINMQYALVDQRVFDDVYRDPRGRFITQAFFFDIGNQSKLPKVKGGSDATKAQWVPIANLRADNMFADHYFIIRSFLNA